MDVRIVEPYGLALSVARLVLLVAAAAGFLAMHGFGATDQAGLHHSPVGMVAASTTDPAPAMGGHADVLASAAVATAPADDDGSDGHDMAAACLFVLLGVLAAVTLRALRHGFTGIGPSALRAIRHRFGPARSPPRLIFLVLCVFRL